MPRAFLLAVCLVSFLPSLAGAQVTKSLRFDVDGVLPSAEPDITWRRWTPTALESFFSVSGGLLRANTLPGTDYTVGYVYPELGNSGTPIGGGMDTGSPFVVEARVRLAQHNGTDPNTRFASVVVWNGQRRFWMHYVDGAIRFDRVSGYIEVPVDVTEFHTLRMEGLGGSQFHAYVDGVQVATSEFAVSEPGNGFSFSNHGPYVGAEIEWDYVEFAAGENPIGTERSSWGGVKALFE